MSSSEEDYENPLDEVRPLYVQGYLFEPVLHTNNSDVDGMYGRAKLIT